MYPILDFILITLQQHGISLCLRGRGQPLRLQVQPTLAAHFVPGGRKEQGQGGRGRPYLGSFVVLGGCFLNDLLSLRPLSDGVWAVNVSQVFVSLRSQRLLNSKSVGAFPSAGGGGGGCAKTGGGGGVVMSALWSAPAKRQF